MDSPNFIGARYDSNLLSLLRRSLRALARFWALRSTSGSRSNLGAAVSMFCLLVSTVLQGETIIVEGDPGNVASAALGMEVGNLARSVIDYKELRNTQKAKIAELEQKVANEADPGEKAELQRDLDYWKRVDKWSSEMEGTALRAMGIYNIPNFDALGTAVVQGLNNLEQYERQQAAKRRLDFATSVRQRFERSARKQPGDEKLLAYTPVELLSMSEINREFFFKAVQDPKVKAQIEADWKANKVISNDPLNVAFAVSDPLTNMAIRADMGEEDQRAQNAVAEIEALRQEIAKMEEDITGPASEVQHLKEQYAAFQEANLKFMYKKETMTKAELDELDKMRNEIDGIQAKLGKISGPYRQALNAIGDKKSKIESLQATIRIRRERKEYAGLNIWLINGYSPSVSFQEKQRWLAEVNREQNLKPQAYQLPSPLQGSREPASSNPTPTPAPTSAPTPYPGAAGLWKEREQAVRQEYDAAWAAVPEAKRLQLHDDEATFQDTIKAFDPPTRMRSLKQRIELLKRFAPRPVRKL